MFLVPVEMPCCRMDKAGLMPLLLLSTAATLVAAEWQTGRVTYYGAPEKISRAYDPSRFAITAKLQGRRQLWHPGLWELRLHVCTNGDKTIPYANDAVAAIADGDPDYPGSCGRCYEIRCREGLVLNNQQQPIRITNGFYEGDKFRPYLPDINPNVTDTKGRPFPGNPAAAQGEQSVVCNNGSSVRVRIIDSCPCTQVLPAAAPGVAPGGETRTQAWCCGGVEHFDLSYYAFEQLAHPVYGVMMVDYRTVDCDTGVPLPSGYFDRSTIYSGGPRLGWGYQAYASSDTQVVTKELSPAGTTATCLTMSPKGGLGFECRGCDKPGLQPFKGPSAISFWIRSNAQTDSPFESSVPKGTAPQQIKMFLYNRGNNHYCPSEPSLGTYQPTATSEEWYQYSIPISAFNCPDQGDVTRVDLQNTGERNAAVCIAGVVLA